MNNFRDGQLAKDFNDKDFPESGQGLMNLPKTLKPGAYSLEFWNTFTGEVISRSEITIDDKRRLPILNHRVDIALKLKAVK